MGLLKLMLDLIHTVSIQWRELYLGDLERKPVVLRHCFVNHRELSWCVKLRLFGDAVL